jgi:hypothetical protein
MSEPKHVTMRETVRIEKPSGATITYSAGALQLVDADLADQWITEGKADAYPPEPKAEE